ncbi:Hypothetical_protein [Hexamita inflata]|uniref:Hypothetical_protein n=1 Tax=Hexamita inflata TaxID=28002 RepID=A0AA86QGM4_9EUKA|nr:Hypothetical protein HINF_LOCUS46639 [Hexamita inflata]
MHQRVKYYTTVQIPNVRRFQHMSKIKRDITWIFSGTALSVGNSQQQQSSNAFKCKIYTVFYYNEVKIIYFVILTDNSFPVYLNCFHLSFQTKWSCSLIYATFDVQTQQMYLVLNTIQHGVVQLGFYYSFKKYLVENCY